jgi:hypothetical protein
MRFGQERFAELSEQAEAAVPEIALWRMTLRKLNQQEVLLTRRKDL